MKKTPYICKINERKNIKNLSQLLREKSIKKSLTKIW